jgi:hypothetical protein
MKFVVGRRRAATILGLKGCLGLEDLVHQRELYKMFE